jgi:hypothetical protein
MKNIGAILCLCLLVLGFSHCKSSVEPPFPYDSNVSQGSRNYTWKADTIKNPYLDFYQIWGNSPDNIWTGGALSSDALYHYNGARWALDGRVYLPTPSALWGYGDKVWIGNYNGCIWQFTGNSYQQQVSFHKLGDHFTNFLTMVGSSDKEVYVTCAYRIKDTCYSLLMKYDGTDWKMDKKFDEPCGIKDITYSPRNDRYYLTTSQYDGSKTVYEYDRTNMKKIYKYPDSNTSPTLATIDGYEYIVIRPKIYRYRNGQKEDITEINDSNFGGIIWGRSRNDIFVRMYDGLAHYNGKDIKYLFKISADEKLNCNMAIFDKEIFISSKDYNTGYNIIYHGTLK